MIIDTHCHLHFKEFDADREEVIQRALEAGVQYLVNVGTDPENNEKAHQLAARYPFMRYTAGLHPHSAHLTGRDGFEIRLYTDKMEEFVRKTKPAAIGEIGLDYFKSEADPETQKKVFREMLKIAKKYDLPVIVHSRNAFEDTYAILKEEVETQRAASLRGVMHCFSYDETCLKKLLDLGFLASFTCNVTYKNAAPLLSVILSAPLDRIMLETDSPYLAPQSHRGQRNEPSHLKELVSFLADKKGMSAEDFAARTSQNAIRFFCLPIIP